MEPTIDSPAPARRFDPSEITRPHESLLTYYLIVSAATIIGFPFVFVPLFIRYKTLRYKFDEEGVSMSWGILFHKQVYLAYRRIQDIHVTRNLFERWLGLAKMPLQTASGKSGATMTIEGVRNPEPLRDFLYLQMRGAREEADQMSESGSANAEALAMLEEIRDALRKASRQREKGEE